MLETISLDVGASAAIKHGKALIKGTLEDSHTLADYRVGPEAVLQEARHLQVSASMLEREAVDTDANDAEDASSASPLQAGFVDQAVVGGRKEGSTETVRANFDYVNALVACQLMQEMATTKERAVASLDAVSATVVLMWAPFESAHLNRFRGNIEHILLSDRNVEFLAVCEPMLIATSLNGSAATVNKAFSVFRPAQDRVPAPAKVIPWRPAICAGQISHVIWVDAEVYAERARFSELGAPFLVRHLRSSPVLSDAAVGTQALQADPGVLLLELPSARVLPHLRDLHDDVIIVSPSFAVVHTKASAADWQDRLMKMLQDDPDTAGELNPWSWSYQLSGMGEPTGTGDIMDVNGARSPIQVLSSDLVAGTFRAQRESRVLAQAWASQLTEEAPRASPSSVGGPWFDFELCWYSGLLAYRHPSSREVSFLDDRPTTAASFFSMSSG
ncbi:unnamed protein product [Prorocentrum cordatum]|uniref:Uncharacterized protein n=1 Tax=Prorocentrum cordatum TaxID=2364126 RepID=A0ABN9X6S5_9DINO|nr:unnamed protein product [Polarella glacialis]